MIVAHSPGTGAASYVRGIIDDRQRPLLEGRRVLCARHMTDDR